MFSTENTGLWATDMSPKPSISTYCTTDYKFALLFVSLVHAKNFVMHNYAADYFAFPLLAIFFVYRESSAALHQVKCQTCINRCLFGQFYHILDIATTINLMAWA